MENIIEILVNNIPIQLVNPKPEYFTRNKTIKEECKISVLCSDCKVIITRWGSNLNKYSKKGIHPRCRKCAGKNNQFHGYQKYKETMLEKYGVDNPLKSPLIRKKSLDTCIKRYGKSSLDIARERFKTIYKTDNPFKLEKIKQKILETNFKKYGAANKKQKDLFLRTHVINEEELVNKLKDFLIKNPELSCNSSQTYKTIGASPIYLTRLLNKYNFKSLLKKEYSTSLGELEIYNFLLTLDLKEEDIQRNIRLDFLKGKEVDFYISKFKFAIEFNGLYWHSTIIKSNNKYHFLKRELCEQAGVQLLQISEDVWREKRSIIESIIKSKLNLFSNKIYARKTRIIIPMQEQAKRFLLENHLKGNSSGCSFIGLEYKNELVFLICYKFFGKELYLSRVCTKINSIVKGGLSKLLYYLETTDKPLTIKSYTDLAYFNGKSLESLGFKKKYDFLSWEWTNLKNRFNRQYCKATPEYTEKEHAEVLGLVKIYDAGQRLWLKNN